MECLPDRRLCKNSSSPRFAVPTQTHIDKHDNIHFSPYPTHLSPIKAKNLFLRAGAQSYNRLRKIHSGKLLQRTHSEGKTKETPIFNGLELSLTTVQEKTIADIFYSERTEKAKIPKEQIGKLNFNGLELSLTTVKKKSQRTKLQRTHSEGKNKKTAIQTSSRHIGEQRALSKSTERNLSFTENII